MTTGDIWLCISIVVAISIFIMLGVLWNANANDKLMGVPTSKDKGEPIEY